MFSILHFLLFINTDHYVYHLTAFRYKDGGIDLGRKQNVCYLSIAEELSDTFAARTTETFKI